RALAGATLLLALAYYVLPGLRLPPGALLFGLPLAAAGAFVGHQVHRWLSGRGALAENVLVLGPGPPPELLVGGVASRAPLGYGAVGYLGESPSELGQPLVGPPVVGTLGELRSIVPALRVTLVVAALEDQRGRLPVEALLSCRLSGVRVEDAPSF